MAKLIGRLECTIRIVERGERQVAGARDMVGFGAFEAARAARVEDRDQRFSGQDLLLGDDFAAVLLGLEAGVARPRLAALGRPPLGNPFLEPAVEDRNVTSAEMAE